MPQIILMRRFAGLALSSLFIGLSLLAAWAGSSVAAAGLGPAATPSAYTYLPVVAKQPTPTFTPTPMPTATPACAALGHVLTGQLTLDQSKPSYAVGENIFFHELIANPTGNRVCYGIVGVAVTALSGGGSSFFHTSWSGDLWLNPGCTGPTDHCGGPWGDSLQIGTPGTYSFTLSVCYSPENVCPGSGDWQVFNTISPITVVVWPPQSQSPVTSESGPFSACYLSFADLEAVRMVCPTADK